MNEEETREFWNNVKAAKSLHPEWREGQTLMNVLGTIAYPLYEMVSQTPADCFYQDSRIPKFRETLGI